MQDRPSGLLANDLNKLQEDYHKTVQEALKSLDLEYLRKIQATYFRCGIKCCENPDLSIPDVQRCIEQCEAPLNQAHNLMQSEVSTFQERVQQCATECANRARDRMKPDPNETDLKNAQQEVFNCSKKCVETQLSTGLPALMTRLKTQLQKLRASQSSVNSL